MSERFVVVTTDHTRRGVFAGILESQQGNTVRLRNAQQCVYWHRSTRGVLGLASKGPQEGSRVGPPVPLLEVDGVTAIVDATAEARKLWESQPWSE